MGSAYVTSLSSFTFYYVPTLNFLTIVAFYNLIVVLNSQEPAYHDIVYGGAWKHVTINPSKEYTEVGVVEEKLLQHIKNSEMFNETANIDYLTCFTIVTLLYSLTNKEPLLFTKELLSTDGSTYQVSIPIPIGSTYHCDFKTSSYQHYITVTTLAGDDHLFVLSHIFFSLDYRQNKHKTSLSSLENCEKRINSSSLHILSTLNRKRDLYSHLCDVKSELTRYYEKSSCHIVQANESNVSSTLTTQLNIMTYNIWNFNPYNENRLYLDRIHRLVQLITKAQPDIIGLQEVRIEALKGGQLGPSQMDHIMPFMKQYQFVFQPAQVFESSLEGGRSEEGVAILSKYPILYHDYLLLFRNTSNPSDSHQRICLHAVVDVPRIGPVHVFNTHYSLSHEAREKASMQILEFMALHQGPTILLGDLNATPEEKSIRLLLQDSGLVDSWPHHHQDGRGYTFNTLENKLSKRIDYILMRKLPNVELKDVAVIDDNTRTSHV